MYFLSHLPIHPSIPSTHADVIEMFTFMPFSPSSSNGSCENLLPLAINKFDYKNLSWIANDDVFPRKFRNLFECPIKVVTFDYPPSIVIETLDNKSTTSSTSKIITGHDIELLNGIAKMLNFNLTIDILFETAAWGQIFENGSATGVMRRVINREADIGIGTYYLTSTRAKYMSFIQYSYVDTILTVPRALTLSPLEKLLSPFSRALWISLMLSFCIGFCVISLLLKFNAGRFALHFGNNLHMNMLSIMLNGYQNDQHLPQQSSARFIFLSFVLFCMVINTLYTGQIFKFLQSDQRHAEIETIDELIEKNYDIFMYDSFQELSSGLKIHQK